MRLIRLHKDAFFVCRNVKCSAQFNHSNYILVYWFESNGIDLTTKSLKKGQSILSKHSAKTIPANHLFLTIFQNQKTKKKLKNKLIDIFIFHQLENLLKNKLYRR